MEKIQLKASEILYLAALCGAEAFYGIPDGFYGMNEAEIAMEINRIKVELMEKDYFDMNFDGEYEIDLEVSNVISQCAAFDRYIALDKNINGKKGALRFYIKDDVIYRLSEAENEYVIEGIFRDVFNQNIKAFITWKNRENQTKAVDLEKDMLKKVKDMSELEQSKQLLLEKGCNDATAKLIYEGLKEHGEYYSFTYIDYCSDVSTMKNFLFLFGNEGSLELKPLFKEGKEWVVFQPISEEEAQSKIKELFEKVSCKEEEYFE